MPAKKFKKVEKVEIKEEVKEEVVEEKVMTTKKDKEEVIYGNEKSKLRCVETLCTASRGWLTKWIRYFVTKEIAKEYANNLQSI